MTKREWWGWVQKLWPVVLGLIVMGYLIMLLIPEVQAAGTGMPMMKGLKSPTELATLVERSLKSDPTGKRLLDPARCKKDGSCATAYDYFYGIGLAHPSAKLDSIAELPRYLRSLVKKSAPTGEWYMSRMLVKGAKHTYDHAGWKRAFFKGEVVWDDLNTGEHILAGDCGNIVAPVPIKPKVLPAVMVTCANLYVTVPAGLARTVRFTLIRYAAIPDFNCWGVIERQWRTGSPHDCDWCEWTDDGVFEMKRRYGGNFNFFHTSIYTMHPDVDASGNAQPTEVTIVLPLAAINGGVAVCVEVDGVIYPAALVLPPTWREGKARIPADFWTNPRVINP